MKNLKIVCNLVCKNDVSPINSDIIIVLEGLYTINLKVFTQHQLEDFYTPSLKNTNSYSHQAPVLTNTLIKAFKLLKNLDYQLINKH